MKKCPKCNAEIDENANFCIYCMTSLAKKEIMVFPKRRMKKKTITVIALVLVIAFAFTPFFRNNDSIETANTTMIVDTPSPTPFVIAETAAPTVSFTVIPTHTLTVAPTQAITKRPTKRPTEAPTPAPTLPSMMMSHGEIVYTEATYEYLPAYITDYFDVDTQGANMENDIMITKVIPQGESNGVYVIPETITVGEGENSRILRVIGVYQSSFEGTGAYEIYLPKSIIKIHSPIIPYQEQIELKTHLYIASEEFYFNYTLVDAYGNLQTIMYKNLVVHCPIKATNNEYSSLSDMGVILNDYRAPVQYEEWNG